MSREDTTAWTQEVRLQKVIGRVESGTEAESESGDRTEQAVEQLPSSNVR